MTEERSSGRAFFERQQKRRREMQARLAHRPVAEEPAVQEQETGEPPAEEPVATEPVIEEIVIEEPAAEEPVAEEIVIEELVAEEPAMEETVIEGPPIGEPPALRLVVTSSGPNVGQTFGLDRREMIIGREEGSDIRLDNLTVSHDHALVRTHSEVVTIEDLRSKNGTTVNGKPVSRPVAIAPGDLITVGAVELLFERY
jgi:hypothetical protein